MYVVWIFIYFCVWHDKNWVWFSVFELCTVQCMCVSRLFGVWIPIFWCDVWSMWTLFFLQFFYSRTVFLRALPWPWALKGGSALFYYTMFFCLLVSPFVHPSIELKTWQVFSFFSFHSLWQTNGRMDGWIDQKTISDVMFLKYEPREREPKKSIHHTNFWKILTHTYISYISEQGSSEVIL